jgi:undecaprenyl-diphosphatase
MIGDSATTTETSIGIARPDRRRETVALAVAAVAVVALAIAGGGGPLTPVKAVVLGAIEGITEFLPVSSTGHLLVVQRLLGLGAGDGRVAADTYAIAIQLGAILAVVALFRDRIAQLFRGLVGHDAAGTHLLTRLIVAFAPAAAIGVVFGDSIKSRLFGPWPVVGAWAVGGAFLLWWRPTRSGGSLELLTHGGAAVIGCAQTLALWPGVSRSLVTIVAALAVGLTMSAAVEFSFLLGLATLSAATLLDLSKDGGTLVSDYGWRTPLLGAIVAFVTALAAVRWLVTYLRTRPLTIFGWYRLLAAATTVVLIAAGAI